MQKPIAIIAGEPNSISSEIIFKLWKRRKKFKHRDFLIIGNIDLLNIQKKKLLFSLNIKEIKKDFNSNDLKGNKLPVININYKQKKPFQKISKKSNTYIFNSFNAGIDLIKSRKVIGIINCPIYKETLLESNYKGITEYLSKKSSKSGNEVMLIYNKKLSVSPITTHIPLKQVSSEISVKKIVKKVETINNFYNKVLKKKANIAVLGLNPHNFSPFNKGEEKKIIIPSIKILKKKKIKVLGPVSPDSSFLNLQKNKINLIIGMYHDQVLTTFKTTYKFNAINITLGLPYIRISPDHGVATDITGKKNANPESLIESIKFFNLIK
jgi:4-hydroxythreonine-4-phosphate dehydrogenase